jgi:hypothetical protein
VKPVNTAPTSMSTYVDWGEGETIVHLHDANTNIVHRTTIKLTDGIRVLPDAADVRHLRMFVTVEQGQQESPEGSVIVDYFEAEDVARVFHDFVVSQSPFDRWFKQRFQAITGLDVSHVVAELPSEQILDWRAP